jgi:putative membrane protein
MLINDKFNVYQLLRVTGLKFLALFILAAAVAITSTRLELRHLLFPTELVAIIVAAVSIFLAFRINTGYARWWQARLVWGSFVNDSRTLGMYVASMMRKSDILSDDEAELHRRIIYRQIGYVNAFRLQLRGQGEADWSQEIWRRKINGLPLFSEAEAALLEGKSNKATQIIMLQAAEVSAFFDHGEDYRHVTMAGLLRDIYGHQGQSEAIKTTVLAWGYAFYTRILVGFLAGIIIFSQVNDLSLPAITLVAFIATVFVTIEQVGRNLDNPFENSFNDAPLSTLCRVIEIDLLQQIGQPCDLKPLTPVNGRLN